jgi:hypothetical protein
MGWYDSSIKKRVREEIGPKLRAQGFNEQQVEEEITKRIEASLR